MNILLKSLQQAKEDLTPEKNNLVVIFCTNCGEKREIELREGMEEKEFFWCCTDCFQEDEEDYCMICGGSRYHDYEEDWSTCCEECDQEVDKYYSLYNIKDDIW